MTSENIYASDLDRGPANYVALSPLSFLERSASVYPDKLAVVHGDLRYTYAEFSARCRRLASALRKRGVGPGDTVSVISPNIPELFEPQFEGPCKCLWVLECANIFIDNLQSQKDE